MVNGFGSPDPRGSNPRTCLKRGFARTAVP
jgi:hypothetical protein